MIGWRGAALVTGAALMWTAPALAQETAPVQAAYLADSASPFGAPPAVDPATVKMPKLDFTPAPTDAADYDKYYYFHRADTDFATAYADILECDGYARGLIAHVGDVQVPYPYTYTLGGAIGGALGNVFAAAVFGSGEKRRVRRMNMRACMHFKGYARYGLSKALWNEFNFEEGLSGVKDEERAAYLQQQARVASSAAPQGKELGL